jgi:hypothetical protein
MILLFRYSFKISSLLGFCMLGSCVFYSFGSDVYLGSAGLCGVLLVCAIVVELTREYYVCRLL